ncbi:hypothetical protein PF007_g7731 [Phytophthora fragariae]|nr:hypothetical protein PF007_g7731 [Phytophthora fragariae]KAE9317894.1 hypothetical protein PF001_g6636 [Phytophthora fragariae]
MESTEPAAEASKTAAEPSEPVEAETVEDGGLNSDVDGDDADSEDWYTETDPAAEIESTIAVREQMEGGGVATDVVADDGGSSASDDDLDGVVLLGREGPWRCTISRKSDSAMPKRS